jgi:hypothetical protein
MQVDLAVQRPEQRGVVEDRRAEGSLYHARSVPHNGREQLTWHWCVLVEDGAQRSLPGNQWQSVALSGTQWQSGSLKTAHSDRSLAWEHVLTPLSRLAIKGNQGQSREIAPGMKHVCTSLQDWGDTWLASAIAAAFAAAAAAAVAAAAAHYVLERGAIRRMNLSNSEGAIEAPRDAISHRDAISLRQLVQRELLGEMGAQLGEVKCLLIVGTHTLRPAEAYSGLQRSAVVSSQLWQPAILRAPPSSSELLRAPPSSSETLLRAPPSSFSELLLRAPPSSSETLLRAPPSSSELIRAPPSSSELLLRAPPSSSELLLRAPPSSSFSKAITGHTWRIESSSQSRMSAALGSDHRTTKLKL